MTEAQIYFLSMFAIVIGSAFFGFLLGRPYWFAKGLIEGIQRGGEIWEEAVTECFDGDDDDDRVLNARTLK